LPRTGMRRNDRKEKERIAVRTGTKIKGTSSSLSANGKGYAKRRKKLAFTLRYGNELGGGERQEAPVLEIPPNVLTRGGEEEGRELGRGTCCRGGQRGKDILYADNRSCCRSGAAAGKERERTYHCVGMADEHQ